MRVWWFVVVMKKFKKYGINEKKRLHCDFEIEVETVQMLCHTHIHCERRPFTWLNSVICVALWKLLPVPTGEQTGNRWVL